MIVMLLCGHLGGTQSKFWFAIDYMLIYKRPTVKHPSLSISAPRGFSGSPQIIMKFSDLARQLKVSTATVSRALSRPEKVAPETRKRVLDFVQRSGYHMNGIARSLRTQSTRTIGVIVSDIRNPFSSAVVKSVEDVARTNGYTVLICNADEDGRNEEVALELFIERQVSGVIHCSAGANLDLLRVLLQKSIPLVDLDRQSGLENVDTVILDNRLGAALATRHLLELGHIRVAMISGPKHLSNARKRLDAFRKTLRSERIALPNEYIEFGDFREHSGRIAAERLLSLETPPTAILVANNEMMAGALLAIRQRRVKVPRDLSVIGFDDARWAQYSDPPLTVISQPTEVMGQKAAELLLGRLNGEKESTTVMFKPELIIRGSTAAPRGA
jgi:DNA-binding LacI/PurR family transcriptional regulator